MRYIKEAAVSTTKKTIVEAAKKGIREATKKYAVRKRTVEKEAARMGGGATEQAGYAIDSPNEKEVIEKTAGEATVKAIREITKRTTIGVEDEDAAKKAAVVIGAAIVEVIMKAIEETAGPTGKAAGKPVIEAIEEARWGIYRRSRYR